MTRKLEADFSADELVVIDITEPADYETDDTWANDLCARAEQYDATLSAPDYDGTTGGNQRGINVLIPRDELEYWQKAADDIGCTLRESAFGVHAGRYGDGNWDGVILAEADDRLYWLA